MSRGSAQGFLWAIEAGKSEPKPEIERVGKPTELIAPIARRNTDAESPKIKHKDKSSSRKPLHRLLNRSASSSTVVNTSTSPTPPDDPTLNAFKPRVRSSESNALDNQPKILFARSPATPTRRTSVTQAVDRSFERDEDESIQRKHFHHSESVSSPNTLRSKEYSKRRTIFPQRQNSPQHQNQSESMSDYRHLHQQQQQTDDMESYLKAWARLQLNEMHGSHGKSGSKSVNRSRNNSHNERYTLLSSTQEGIPFYRRGLLMMNSASQTTSDISTQTLGESKYDEERYSPARISPDDADYQMRRTASLQNVMKDINAPKIKEPRYPDQPLRKASMREMERNRLRESLKSMMSGNSSAPKISEKSRVSKSSTVTRNNSWSQLQQLEHRIEMKSKKLMDRGILPPSTSPSPASGAPDVSSPTNLNHVSPSFHKPGWSNGSSPAGTLMYRASHELRSSVSQASFEDLQSMLHRDEDWDDDEIDPQRCVAPGPLEMLVGGFEEVMPKTVAQPPALSTPKFGTEQPRANVHAMRLQLSKSPVHFQSFSSILPPDQTKNNVIFSTAFSAFSPADKGDKHSSG